MIPDEIKLPESTSEKEVKMIKKICPKDIVIAWEHYETNYLRKPADIDVTNDFDDEDEEDDDVDIEDIMPAGFMKFGMMNQPKEVHYTPWGKFEDDNPLSPVKLYDLQMVHFKGFKTSDVSANFKSFISQINGVAIWGQIDPYCLIIGPSKLYDFKEVKHNLESAIYKSLLIEREDLPVKNLDEIYNTVQQKSLDSFNNGVENIMIIFPDENHSIETIVNFTKKDIESVDDLIQQVNDLIVFINGENYV